MCHYFSLSQLNATAKFSQVFMLTQNKTIQWVFFFTKYLFSETVAGKFEKMKTKAMVLVIAKMNMKVHFNFLILSTKI